LAVPSSSYLVLVDLHCFVQDFSKGKILLKLLQILHLEDLQNVVFTGIYTGRYNALGIKAQGALLHRFVVFIDDHHPHWTGYHAQAAEYTCILIHHQCAFILFNGSGWAYPGTWCFIWVAVHTENGHCAAFFYTSHSVFLLAGVYTVLTFTAAPGIHHHQGFHVNHFPISN